MGQVREVDAISDAIIETEREIAGEAWGNEDTERADSTGDRTLESMGDGLEGQHEAGDDDAEAEGDEDAEGEDEGGDGEDGEEGEAGEEGEGETEPKGEVKTEPKTETREQGQQGRVPSGKLREEAEKRRLAETALETERAGRAEDRKAFETLQTQVQTLTQLLQGQRQPPQAPVKEEPKTEPEAVPDIFENPTGFVEHIKNVVQQAVTPVRSDMRKTMVETSFAIAHSTHKDTFANAFQAINKLDPQNPDDRATVQRIYNSPNPGEELVKWHRRNEALRRVGDDPTAYEERIRTETRESLLKDPEFRKALLADLRAEAETGGQNGSPRTQTRLPPSLARRGGSNLGVERGDHDRHDNSEQGVADAAWR